MISRGIPPPSPPSPFSCAAVAFFPESWVFLKALVPHFKGKIIKKKKEVVSFCLTSEMAALAHLGWEGGAENGTNGDPGFSLPNTTIIPDFWEPPAVPSLPSP